jgi:radical SAM modification target selenobiotic family peptide
MDKNKIKKYLKVVCLASLIAGSSLMISGCATKTGSENDVKPDAATSQQEQPTQPVRSS